MHSLFPHAQIICDRFHYIRLAGQNFIQSRLDACSFLHDKPLAKSIKRNLRLFYKYKKIWIMTKHGMIFISKDILPVLHILTIFTLSAKEETRITVIIILCLILSLLWKCLTTMKSIRIS
ncbi:MAG: hypothetical protein ACLSBH_18550 [Coprobacillus cateniformis]